GELAQHDLAGLGEAVDGPGDADDLAEPGRRGGAIEAQDVIPRHDAVAAVAAGGISPLQVDGPHPARDRPGPGAGGPGRFVALRAAQARPLVPPFFRSFRAVSMALAPILCTRSRTSNSVCPRSRRSGLEASDSARERRSDSTACRRDWEMRSASSA